MAVNELVASIQSIFPPSGQIPPPTSDQPEDGDVEGLPPNLSPTPRHLVPDWIEPGEGTSFPEDGILDIEGETPAVQKGTSFPEDGILDIEGETPAVQKGLPAVIDVLAYYLPFHFYRHGWGIYLRASGVLSVASMLASASGRGLSGDLLSLASTILLQHERFHFLSEIACSRAELVSEDELYRHYFHDRGATAVEEALSNAHAFRTALRRKPAAIRAQVKQWMQAQGPGYRDFVRCLTPSTFTSWSRSTTQRMICSARGIFKLSPRAGKSVMRHGPVLPHTTPTEFLFTGLARSPAPAYLVRDVAGIAVLRPFPKYAGLRVLVHTNDHPPPHIHVEIPPGRDFTRLEWPALQSLPGDPALSGSQRKSLGEYLSKYREQIDQKIRQVYGLRPNPRSSRHANTARG